MRIVVTGGSGRLGVSVVTFLHAQGHDVVSFDRAPHPTLPPGTHRTVDLADPGQTWSAMSAARPEAVVHLAAIATPFSLPDHIIYETNSRIAYTVTEAAIAAGARKVLSASSPTVLGYGTPRGWVPQYLPLDEKHPTAPWNGYALSKQNIETIMQMFHHKNGDTVTLGAFRPCYVISPPEWAGAPTQQGHTLYERLQNPALSAVALFNYVDARDVGTFVEAWLQQASPALSGETFFVGASDALATRPLADLMPLYWPGTEATAAHLTGRESAFDCSKAERLLGWSAERSWRTELTGAPADLASHLAAQPTSHLEPSFAARVG
ncbi:NAD(P)-dependent oxidoreductase [Micrococcales bacterium 31B]|nr:NAD(P)-dependent oxidoreductase [Micrococcales bacterium 31B]